MCFFCGIQPWQKNKRQSYKCFFLGFSHFKIWQWLKKPKNNPRSYVISHANIHNGNMYIVHPLPTFTTPPPKPYILHQVVKPNVKFHRASKQNIIFHHWWGHVFTLGWKHGKLDRKWSLEHKWKVGKKYALIYWT